MEDFGFKLIQFIHDSKLFVPYKAAENCINIEWMANASEQIEAFIYDHLENLDKNNETKD